MKGINKVTPFKFGSDRILDKKYKFKKLGIKNVDIYHLFNSVNVGEGLWVSTFETTIPRHSETISIPKQGSKASSEVSGLFDKIAAPSCRAIIALSKNAAKLQGELIDRLEIKEKLKVKSKIDVVYPPQNTIIDDVSVKNFSNEKIIFTFVGRSFFRKGGREILNVFSNLPEEEKSRIKLNIVSSVDVDPYATGESQRDANKAEHRLQSMGDWLTHYRELQHSEVLSLMRKSHVGLLPTHADTFGYSVLEFQAAGCPVISTNLRALPEINSRKTGWLIDVPVDSLGRGIYHTPDQQEEMRISIRSGLRQTVNEILDDPDQIQEKSAHSLQRIRQNHDPASYASKIKNIYSGY